MRRWGCVRSGESFAHAQVMSKSEDCGAPIGRVRVRKLGSLPAPRLCGDILEPMPRRLTSVSAVRRKERTED